MSRRRIAVLLEISEISGEILPVVRRLFSADQAELTLIAVAQRNLSPMVTEAYLTGMPPSLYASPIYTEDEWDGHLQDLQEVLHQTAQQLRVAGYTVQTVLLKGDKVQAIVDYVEKRPFDLVAMATYGRKGLSRLVYGSVAERLLRILTAPMLLFRHQAEGVTADLSEPASAPALRPAFTVVTATDGAPHSRTAVLMASTLARALGASCTILVTADQPQGAAADQQLMRSVDDLVRGLEPRPTLTPLIGAPDQTIGRYMERNPADLLVIGAVDNGDLGGAARRVLEAARKSVLVVKGEGRLARMLVCVTDHATPLLDEALQYAQALDARLEVAYVAPPRGANEPEWLDTTSPTFNDVLAQDRQLAGAWQRIQSRLNDRGVAAEALHVGFGDAVEAVLQLTRQQSYDLLVTGVPDPGRTFADSFVDQLVRQSMQSVLVIRA